MVRNTKKRILVISQLYPSASTGTSVKTRHTLEFLAENGFKLDVCCLHSPKMVKRPLHHPNIHMHVFRTEALSRFSFAYLKKVWRLLLTTIPFRVAKLYNKKLNKKACNLLKKHSYEYFLFDGFSTIQYVMSKSKKNIYIDDEDIVDLMKKRLATTKNVLAKVFFFLEWIKCIFYERRFLKQMNQVWAISTNTKQRLASVCAAKTLLMPTIVPLAKSSFSQKSKHIVFSGLLSWMENIVGIRWFLETCWADIHQRFPRTKLIITGQMADEKLKVFIKQFPNVRLVGFVPSLTSIYNKCALAISPIFINAGIKVKTVTYLSYGLPVVSSKEATLGLTSKNGIVSVDKNNFSKAVKALLLDTKKREIYSYQGRENIKRYHSKAALRRFFCTAGAM